MKKRQNLHKIDKFNENIYKREKNKKIKEKKKKWYKPQNSSLFFVNSSLLRCET